MSDDIFIHSDFIGIVASIYKPSIYVELGCQFGYTLERVAPYAKTIYGIDIQSSPRLESIKNQFSNIDLQITTTNNFFETFNEGIDMAFIDADHKFESCKQDFDNVLQRLNPGGIIFLHDTDPEDNSLFDPSRCGDSYKIVNLLENRNDVNIVTLPIREAGLTLVTKKNNTRIKLHNSIQ